MKLQQTALIVLATAYLATPLCAAKTPTPPDMPGSPRLNFQRLTLNTGGDTPEACLRFDQPLDSAAAPQYADHLTLTPSFKPDVRVSGTDLCLGGLGWNTRYQIALSPGLRDMDGGKLAVPVHVSVATGDRMPQLALTGNGYILPRLTAAGIDVQSVNMDRARIVVWRLPKASSLRMSGTTDNGPRIDLSATSMSSWEFQSLHNAQLTRVWAGVLDIRNDHNKTVTTAFPLAGVVQGKQSGLYLVTAENAATPAEKSILLTTTQSDMDSDELAMHWVNVSDIGLSAIQGHDGLHVFVRSLATAKLLSGIAVSLIAQNGDELGQLTTDSSGQAVFAPGLLRGQQALAPVSVMAQGAEGDFAMLQVNQSWFDFSDHGSAGHPAPGAQQAVLVTDRGLYRPGETVNITALLRDQKGNALSNQPLVLVLTRPDGVEAQRVTLPARAGGGFVTTETLASSAPHGTWSLSAYADPTSPSIGGASFSVQDFVPQTLETTLTSSAKTFPATGELDVQLTGRYLYGAPATGLHGEGWVKIIADTTPLPGLSGYTFGLCTQTLDENNQKLAVPDTDDQGNTTFSVTPNLPSGQNRPLSAVIEASLFEPTGRAVKQTLSLPLARTQPIIGISTQDSGSSGETQSVPADIVTLGPDDKPVAIKNLAWNIARENVVYDWIYDAGRWSFHEHVIDEPVQHGTTSTAENGRASLSLSLAPARYLLVVTDPATGVSSSRKFYVGWWSADNSQTNAPDRLTVTPKETTIAPNGSTSVHIEAPFAGKAQVIVATDHIESIRTLDIPQGGADIPVQAGADWPGGAYVLATLYRPLDAPARAHEPIRAVGLAYIGTDQSAHRLSVSLKAPDVVRSRTKLSIPVTIKGGQTGPLHLTLAAVDKGIIGLTDWKQPDIFKSLYGQQALAIDVTDTYAHLLTPSGLAGAIHEGGDEGSGQGSALAVTSTRVVSLFSGEVTPDASGHAVVTLDVPDFEGTLDLMATAWRDDAVGTGSAETIVRDPVFTEITLPRFLAPGDTATSLVSLVNTDGAAGHYTVSLKADGPVTLTGAHDFAADLTKGTRKSFPTTLSAQAPGIAHITATLHDASGHTLLNRAWDIQVRAGHLPMTRSLTHQQAPGESYTLPPNLLADFEPGATLTLSYTGVNGVDTIGLLQSLQDISWGSSENLASTARALLSFKGHEHLGAELVEGGVNPFIRNAITTLLNREDAGGRIGDWRLNDGGTLPSTQIYLVDFLSRAKAAGYAVPQPALNRALDWLATEQANASNTDSDTTDTTITPDTRAYALYVLAQAGRPNAPALRALYDNINIFGGSDQKRTLFWGSDAANATKASALALGHLAGGLMLANQRNAGHDVFAFAREALVPPRIRQPYPFDAAYWIYVRDLTGLAAVAAESGDTALAQHLVDRFATLAPNPADLLEQSKVNLLETASALNHENAGRAITINGKRLPEPLNLPVAFTPTPAEQQGYTLTNAGSTPLWLSVTTNGAPKEAAKPISKGFTLTVSTLNMDGQPVNPDYLRQNDRFVVIINGTVKDRYPHQCVITDMLPAGWEIEGALSGGSENSDDTDNGLPFLGQTTAARSISVGDDRFVAAFNIDANSVEETDDTDSKDHNALPAGAFRFAYSVRAVTPGHFLRPETVVQDIYQPTKTARTAAGTTTIDPR
ncbi:MAG: MG2 domain-containing protein [Acetobacter papayae]